MKKHGAQPFEVTLSLAEEKFASGGARDAYIATPLSGLSPGKYVLKKVQDKKSMKLKSCLSQLKSTHEKQCK